MRYVSLFSGIEAASVAWQPLGWEPVAFAEIEPFPCAVLSARFPEVPNLGDVTKIDWSPYVGSVDVIVGGSPCQSFSIAGRREGLSGESGLMFEYIRAVQEVRPRWFVWENVPGALSSEHGDAFRQLLSEMDAIGYGLAWRVLDAQFFGVPQRRERLFLVGCLGDPERACQVLLEPEMLRGDLPSSRAKREELAADAGCRAARETGCIGFASNKGTAARSMGEADELSPTLLADGHHVATVYEGAMNSWDVQSKRVFGVGVVTPSVCYAQNQRYEVRVSGDGQTHGALPSRWSGKQFDFVTYPSDGSLTPWESQARRVFSEDGVFSALASRGSSGQDQQSVLMKSREPQLWEGDVRDFAYTLRRLMPVECERLQGFPNGWTNVEFKGKPASDTARYRALGNSMAVPVMRWIGERIEETP